MSREGTLIKTRYPYLYFDNIDISSVSEAESTYNSLDKRLNRIKSDIATLVFSTPRDITPKGEQPLDYLNEKLDELFDELYEVSKDFYTTDIVKDILNEWSWGGYSDDKELYPNSKSDEEVNEKAFIEDSHIEVIRDMKKFTFAPPDDNVNTTLTRCIKNIQLNDSLSLWVGKKYIILLGNKLYVDYDGQFIFNSKTKAENILKKKMDFHAIDYISKEFNELHPNYFKTVIDNLKNNKEKFIEDLKILEDGNTFKHVDSIEFLYTTFEKYVIDEVFKILDVKIVEINELIDTYKQLDGPVFKK